MLLTSARFIFMPLYSERARISKAKFTPTKLAQYQLLLPSDNNNTRHFEKYKPDLYTFVLSRLMNTIIKNRCSSRSSGG